MRQGEVSAKRKALRKWVTELLTPWMGTLEATIFTGWIYDFLKPHAVELKVAHPAMLKAITAAKKNGGRRREARRPVTGQPAARMYHSAREITWAPTHPALPKQGRSQRRQNEE